nr:uncharacterized protein LOC129382418 isoform X2 [Dermacentor andersoni]
MKAIEARDWKSVLQAYDCIILSIHLSYETFNAERKASGLGQFYALPCATFKIGSSFIYTMLFIGGSRELFVTFTFGNQEKKIKINVYLTKGEEFIVYIQNVPKGYIVNTSLDNLTTWATRVRGVDLIAPKFSDNCTILKCVAVSIQGNCYIEIYTRVWQSFVSRSCFSARMRRPFDPTPVKDSHVSVSHVKMKFKLSFVNMARRALVAIVTPDEIRKFAMNSQIRKRTRLSAGQMVSLYVRGCYDIYLRDAYSFMNEFKLTSELLLRKAHSLRFYFSFFYYRSVVRSPTKNSDAVFLIAR